MDLVAWLRGLGLEQYAPTFRDNDVGRGGSGEIVRRRNFGTLIDQLGLRLWKNP